MNVTVSAVEKLQGRIRVPGDKSISHRSLMFGALAEGTTRVTHLLESGDVHSTWRCLEGLGARIWRNGPTEVRVEGLGLHGFRAPTETLDCGNSGTTIRLLMGMLTGQPFSVSLTGDHSLRKRPMKRIAEPLIRMGAAIALHESQFAPLTIRGSGTLLPLHYELPVASAQLKSALILAGLFAEGTTVLGGKIVSRDHTERMLPHFGVAVETSASEIRIRGGQRLRAADVKVPGDISSAAFWIAAATLVRNAEVLIENVLLNPSRVGVLNALQRMGARIDIEVTSTSPEPVGTLRVRSASLQATRIEEAEVPALIDELPMIAVLATQAEGVTEVFGAEELRVKETDRIEAVARNLRLMGAEVETRPDGFSIRGPQKLKGASLESYHDHRIAMAFSIAGLIASGSTEILGTDCVGISYPDFYETLDTLKRG